MAAPIWSIPPDLVRHKGIYAASEPWHLPVSVWGPIWEETRGGSGITVCVLDTGIDYSHELLPEPIIEPKSFIPGESWLDRNSHGTHCSGTVLARRFFGVSPNANLMIGKVLSDRGSGSSQGIAEGIEWARENGADVISMSLGGGQSYNPTNRAIDRCVAEGKIVNCAAGNSGYDGHQMNRVSRWIHNWMAARNTIGWPAKHHTALCTGASNRSGKPARFSSGGEQMDVMTPGVDILSTLPRGRQGMMSGTSMATPFMSGLWALVLHMLRRNGAPMWTTVDGSREFLEKNCKDVGPPGRDPSYGFGIPMYSELVRRLRHNDLII